VVRFPFVSVGATENLLMAATLAKGETVLENAAREPEVVNLAECLVAMGARIEGAGTSTITIAGVDTLSGACHKVIPDRIETGTYAMAVAMTGGDVLLEGARADLLQGALDVIAQTGTEIIPVETGIRVRRNGAGIAPVDVVTEPFPGFPTDLQAQFMGLMTMANGKSRITETIFENRFMHVQDAVMKVGDLEFSAAAKRFIISMNRFAWETGTGMLRARYQRRKSVLDFNHVLGVKTSGIDRDKAEDVLSLLAIRFHERDAPAGAIELVFSGGGVVALQVECIEARLADLGSAWETTSRPVH
jgi:hypothetical protein